MIYKLSYCNKKVHGKYELLYTINVGSPVMALEFQDLSGDGVKTLIALTYEGLQTFTVSTS